MLKTILENKVIALIVLIVIIAGVLVLTKANFSGHVGAVGQGASISVGPEK